MEIYKAWKNEIYDGSIPVGPGGIMTSLGAITPTLAAAATLLASILGLRSKTDSSVKIKPIFPLSRSFNYSISGIALPKALRSSYFGSFGNSLDLKLIALLKMVFFPISKIPLCICRSFLIY